MFHGGDAAASFSEPSPDEQISKSGKNLKLYSLYGSTHSYYPFELPPSEERERGAKTEGGETIR